MAYYLSKERDADVVGAYREYQQYLHEHRSGFPPNAFALGTAEWYQNAEDHRCPHDSWLQDSVISETVADDGERVTTIRIRLLGAYHDGHIEFVYPRVFGYSLQTSSCHRGLEDWQYDEFRVSAKGQLIHEIEWAGFPLMDEGARWIITASDVEFRWNPTTIGQAAQE